MDFETEQAERKHRVAVLKELMAEAQRRLDVLDAAPEDDMASHVEATAVRHQVHYYRDEIRTVEMGIYDEPCPVLEEEERQAEWAEREREDVWDS